MLRIKVTPWKALRRHCATIKRLNKHGKSPSSIGAMVGWHHPSWGLICHWVVRQERLSSWGITGKIQRKSPSSKFSASLTSLDASSCLNVTGDILLVCYFKPWMLVKLCFSSGFRVENPTWHRMYVPYRILHSAVHLSVVVSLRVWIPVTASKNMK